ncbi:MAG TPA: hypothetical protein VGS13_07535 [Stellaceae bacterium]|nr:hypothetical protein [Stellaceae bacterium]
MLISPACSNLSQIAVRVHCYTHAIQDPDRATLRHVGELMSPNQIEPRLHPRAIDTPTRLHGDVPLAVELERRPRPSAPTTSRIGQPRSSRS